MANIHVLDEHIANQIAAGEVVERPASVVKELVENAIDAGSTRIDVHVEEGGLTLIRVSDDGSGIAAEDCATAFERHATSKIHAGRDLFRIRSLGFRGEALPSIGAVAKVECITSTNRSGLGRRIVVEGGKLIANEEAAAQQGTTIAVRDLFYNTPARLKYMKTIQTELGHISDYMYRLALAHPRIAFTLKHNGNTLLQTMGNDDLLQAVAAVYGSATARGMIEVRHETMDYRVHGYVGRPETTRANRHGMSFIVNGRYIRNYALAGALLKAYHTLLPINRFPLAVLHIQMEPELVDVNVHPSKLEVRFSKEAELVDMLRKAVVKGLESVALIPSPANSGSLRTEASLSVKPVVQETLDLYAVSRPRESGLAAPQPPRFSPTDQPPTKQAVERFMRGLKPVDSADHRSGRTPDHLSRGATSVPSGMPTEARPESSAADAPEAQADAAVDAPSGSFADEPKSRLPKMHVIGQLHGTYIVAQNETGMFLIDQHAAHERIQYEYYLRKFAQPVQASQELLLAMTMEFTPSESEVLKERLHLFAEAGVYLEPFGGHTFKVTSYPHWLPSGEEELIIREMAEWIVSEKKAPDIGKLREKSAILCSCKASIKANDRQSKEQIERLLDQLREANNPFTCPHGRPIVVSFSTYELEKMFKRVM